MAARTDRRWQGRAARVMRARVGGGALGDWDSPVPAEGGDTGADAGAGSAVRAQLEKDPRSGACAEPQWQLWERFPVVLEPSPAWLPPWEEESCSMARTKTK